MNTIINTQVVMQTLKQHMYIPEIISIMCKYIGTVQVGDYVQISSHEHDVVRIVKFGPKRVICNSTRIYLPTSGLAPEVLTYKKTMLRYDCLMALPVMKDVEFAEMYLDN